MITVIIPTLWKVDQLSTTLRDLAACKYVGEIILIDNTERTKKIELNKLNHILEGKNTYVTAAWNKGAQSAQFDKLLILNDDTWFDWDLMGEIEDNINESAGMIGISMNSYKIKETTNIKLEAIQKRPVGFACAFFIHKNSWSPIPGKMKVFHNDDWLFEECKKNGKQNYRLLNFKVAGRVSATLEKLGSKKYFRQILRDDRIAFQQLMKKEGK